MLRIECDTPGCDGVWVHRRTTSGRDRQADALDAVDDAYAAGWRCPGIHYRCPRCAERERWATNRIDGRERCAFTDEGHRCQRAVHDSGEHVFLSFVR